MKLSMVVSTNKTTFWHRFCESLSQNDCEIEVVFVGPVGRDRGKLPVPVRFIDIDVNAALCWEIGARSCNCDLLGLAADDCVFTPGYLDAVVREASKAHDRHDMFTARYVHNNVDQLPGQRFLSVQTMPVLPVGGFTYMETHRELGGIDRRFNAVLWDTDLYAHMYQLGGRATLLDDHLCHEVNNISKLFVENHAADRQTIESLWPRPYCPEMQRTSARLPYTEAETSIGHRYVGE